MLIEVWSVAGALCLIIATIGAMMKWNSHDAYDVQLAEIKCDGKLKLLKLENERLKLEVEREKRLLGDG